MSNGKNVMTKEMRQNNLMNGVPGVGTRSVQRSILAYVHPTSSKSNEDTLTTFNSISSH